MQKLKESELRYRRLFEAAQDGILILDAKTGMIEDVNPFLINMLGYSREEFIKKKLWEVGAFRDIEASQDAFEALQKNEYIRYDDLPLKAKNGRLIQVEFVSNVYAVGDEKVIQCNIRDITERKQVEGMRTQLAAIVDSSDDAIIGKTLDGVVTSWNPGAERLYGYSAAEAIGRPISFLVPPDHPDELPEIMERLKRGESLEHFETARIRKDGASLTVSLTISPIKDSLGQIKGASSIARDITERKQAEERMQRQLGHLTALSAIDRVIAANLDLKLSLTEILVHVTQELDVDAADILIFDPDSQTLEFGAGRGFRTQAAKKVHIRLGEGNAGRVALERQLVQSIKPNNKVDNLLRKTHVADDDFACYYGVPLIAKGQVKGVLEVFHRARLAPDAEWFDFLNALAGQAAIAIESSMLFESLQRSNSELAMAYDATIAGWSQAMDLRDRETEGHTQRVTEKTMDLARAFGLSDGELVQVRWGTLLHDIGKMGIPDEILFKPGFLTDEEWVTMKKHPTFAYNMLAPICYLRSALDIPYCHHEKWDGSGYPQGLKGTQIPLAARLFAVVDVWDALKSERPYRAAWPEEKVREYLRNSSGTHFDPRMVEVFMQSPPV